MATAYCRQIRPNGARCRNFALTGKPLCYWHHDLARRHRRLNPTNADLPTTIPEDHRDLAVLRRDPSLAEYYGIDLHGPLLFDFPVLEDRASIQAALSLLLSALGNNRLDPKRAGPMLYLLQVASSNVGPLGTQTRHVVHNTVLDDSGAELSPDEDPGEVLEAQQLLDSLDQEQSEADADAEEDED